MSLGGSIIIPDGVNVSFLKEFRKIIQRHIKRYKFVIVTGGGGLARKYISALQDRDHKVQSSAGIGATQANAKFVSCFFGQNPLTPIPLKMQEVERLVKKQDLVICGALGFKPGQTTDSTAAEIAAELKAEFINLTNVSGLYDKDPSKNKDAKFIPKVSWKGFHNLATKSAFKPGQHFVLDQNSSRIIMKGKVKTYILGKNLKNINEFLSGKKFKGTVIFG